MSMVGQGESADIFVSELKAKLVTYDNRVVSFTFSIPMIK